MKREMEGREEEGEGDGRKRGKQRGRWRGERKREIEGREEEGEGEGDRYGEIAALISMGFQFLPASEYCVPLHFRCVKGTLSFFLLEQIECFSWPLPPPWRLQTECHLELWHLEDHLLIFSCPFPKGIVCPSLSS